jgi:hypothetical protein
VEAGAFEVSLRAARRFSIGVRTHQNAGEVFGSSTQRDARTFFSEKRGEKLSLRLGDRRNLPVRAWFRLRRRGSRGVSGGWQIRGG